MLFPPLLYEIPLKRKEDRQDNEIFSSALYEIALKRKEDRQDNEYFQCLILSEICRRHHNTSEQTCRNRKI